VRAFTTAILVTSLLVIGCGGESAPPPKVASRPAPKTSVGPRAAGGATGAGHSTGMSYDEALAEPEDVMALRGQRELRNDELTAPVKTPTFLNTCGVPESTSVTLKIAVRDGKTLGVTVITEPDDATLAECVDKAIRDISWPESKHRDSFVIKY
jgi:hypothetical protein